MRRRKLDMKTLGTEKLLALWQQAKRNVGP